MGRVRRLATRAVTTGKLKKNPNITLVAGRSSFIYRNFSEMEKNNHYPPQKYTRFHFFSINHYRRAALNLVFQFYLFIFISARGPLFPVLGVGWGGDRMGWGSRGVKSATQCGSGHWCIWTICEQWPFFSSPRCMTLGQMERGAGKQGHRV